MVNQLKNLLTEEIVNQLTVVGEESIGVLFSGGVDSSTIARLIDLQKLPNEKYLFSLTSQNSKDKKYIDLWPHFLNKTGWEFVEVVIPQKEQLTQVATKVNQILQLAFKNYHSQYAHTIFHSTDQFTNMQVSLATALYLVCKEAKSRGVRYLFTGQGSDELFAGYSKYKETETSKLLKKTKQEYERLKNVDTVRDTAVSIHFNVKLFPPFASETVAGFAFSLDNKHKLDGNKNKIIVRELAKEIGISKEIYERPKKAFQYSSGIQKAILH